MKKKTEKQGRRDDVRREYDFSKTNGVRGKYTPRCRARTNIVRLSPDVAEHFPNEQAVNKALRTLIQSAKGPLRRTRGTRLSGQNKYIEPTTCEAVTFRRDSVHCPLLSDALF